MTLKIGDVLYHRDTGRAMTVKGFLSGDRIRLQGADIKGVRSKDWLDTYIRKAYTPTTKIKEIFSPSNEIAVPTILPKEMVLDESKTNYVKIGIIGAVLYLGYKLIK